MMVRRSGEASRAALLKAAARLFADQGYHPTKVSEVVAAAGLTQAAFYLYFASKEAIYEELIATFTTGVRGVLANAHIPAGLTRDQLLPYMRANMLASFQLVLAEPDLYRVVMASPAAAAISEVANNLMAQVIDQGKASGYVRPDFPSLLWAQILTAAMSDLIPRYILTGKRTPEELADELIETLAYGSLGSPPGRATPRTG